MKKIIRKILKEEISFDETTKGINLSVKMLKKEYPFIVGWEYSDLPDRWNYVIYIILEIDYKKTLEYYGLEPHPIFYNLVKKYIKNREKVPSQFSLTNYEYLNNFDGMVEFLKLQNDIKEIYQDMVPDKLQMKLGNTESIGKNNLKELKIDNFIYVE